MYYNYGGRGIKFLFVSFLQFHNEVGNKPTKEHSIDRIDSNGNYEPGNIRWATRKEQANNKNSNILYTENGDTRTIIEWCRIKNIRSSIVYDRISKGWSIKDSFYEKKNRNIRKYEINGKIMNISQWSRYYKINVSLVYSRLSRGWSIYDALNIAKLTDDGYSI